MAAISSCESSPVAVSNRSLNWQTAIPVLAIICTSAAVWVFREDLQALSTLGYVGLFLLDVAGSLTVLVPLPVLPLMTLAGASLDPWVSAAVAAAGMAVGLGPSFIAGRAGRKTLNNPPPHGFTLVRVATVRMKGWFQRHQLLAPFLVAAIPFPVLFEVSGVAAGLAQVRAANFFAATMLGTILKRLGEKAGVKANPHRFRHTFATWSIENSARELDVQYLYLPELVQDLLRCMTFSRHFAPLSERPVWTFPAVSFSRGAGQYRLRGLAPAQLSALG
jgi:membrane protein DedA with SNARE-associated domain